MSDTLITQFRPKTFGEVIGHPKVVKALENALEKKAARAYLLTGDAGTGKTTLARLAAAKVGCKPGDIEEIDAATNTGIDEMRAVTERLAYKPIGSEVKAVIVDECHALSRQAWQSLLKILEEPPSWVYWFLCTTEAGKVPKAVVTRCFPVNLKPVDGDVLFNWLINLIEENKLFPKMKEDTVDGIAGVCVDNAMGSPRQALSNLSLCLTATSKKEAAALMGSAADSPEAVELARALIQRQPWSKVQGLLKGMKDANPESIRHVVRAYVTAVALGNPKAGSALEILDLFSQPFPSTDGISPVVLACGKLILGERE